MDLPRAIEFAAFALKKKYSAQKKNAQFIFPSAEYFLEQKNILVRIIFFSANKKYNL